MNKNLTEIVIVLDKSGSMGHLAGDVIGGINTFIAEQKALPGDCNATLVLFNHGYDIAYSGNLSEFPTIDASIYRASGNTAMLDAIGIAIDTTGTRLASMNEADRPNKVIFCILTDGEENSSKEFTGSQIKAKIELQTNTYAWEFMFLGANIDSSLASTSIGINAASNSSSFAANARGIANAFTSYSLASADLRSKGTYTGSLGEYMCWADAKNS